MKKEIIRKECVVLKNPKPYGPVAKTEFGWTGMSLSIGVYEDYVNIHQNVMGKYSKLGVLTYEEPVKKILGLTFYYDFESREIVVSEEVGGEIDNGIIKNEQNMNNNVKGLSIFNDEKFGDIRVVDVEGEIMFVANDIAKCLGYKSPKDAVSQHCKLATKRLLPWKSGSYVDSNGKTVEIVKDTQITIIPESDVYRLTMRSNLQSAVEFQDWVCETVIPAIRKTGGYVGDSYKFVDAYFGELDADTKKFMAITLDSKKKLMEENAIQLKVIEEQKPKVEFYNDVADSNGAHTMDEVAKILSYYGLGRNKLFEFLRDEKILMRNNIPYQKYVDSGYFRLIEQVYDNKGEKMVRIKTLVYQKGIDYIRKLLSNKLKN